jgi:hypothetical protein
MYKQLNRRWIPYDFQLFIDLFSLNSSYASSKQTPILEHSIFLTSLTT